MGGCGKSRHLKKSTMRHVPIECMEEIRLRHRAMMWDDFQMSWLCWVE